MTRRAPSFTLAIALAAAALALSACGAPVGEAPATPTESEVTTDTEIEAKPESAPATQSPTPTEDSTMHITINNHTLRVALANNSSADALRELLAEGPLTVQMHHYGGFEVVGPLGHTLPTNDEPITTEPGDVILYQGNQVTIYYDVNHWDFTRLGRVEGISADELREILSPSTVTATFELGE